jgi:hypothetical protein
MHTEVDRRASERKVRVAAVVVAGMCSLPACCGV